MKLVLCGYVELQAKLALSLLLTLKGFKAKLDNLASRVRLAPWARARLSIELTQPQKAVFGLLSASLNQQGLSFCFVPRDVLSWSSACPLLVFYRCRQVGYCSD